MPNIIETVKNIVTNYTDNEPLPPLHVGEVMNLWTYLTLIEEANRFVEIGLNTTTDSELIEALKHSFKDCAEHAAEVRELFKREGIPLPPTSEPKSDSDPNSVPLGAKMTDNEIANSLSLKLVSAISLCATGAAQSIRNDIGAMWINFLSKRVEFGAYYNPILRKRGWIKTPPYYTPPGAPAHVQ